MATSIITVENVTKRYGSVDAVRGISFEIHPGECYGLLGPNGAGKTTTIGMLTGLIPPSGGTIRIGGLEPPRHRKRVQRLIGFVPQDFAFYPALTAKENLTFFARLYGLRGRHLQGRLEAVLETVRLTRRADMPVAAFSNGMKRRLNIAIGLIHQPQILILDEPTVGIDAHSRNAILESLEALNSGGVSILYTTHYMEEAERLCRRVAVMDHGTIIALDSPAGLIRDRGRRIIRLESSQPFPDKVVAQIERLGKVKPIDDQRKILHVTVFEPAAAMRDLMDTAQQSGLSLRSIGLLEANLENVFLHLTGRSLRD